MPRRSERFTSMSSNSSQSDGSPRMTFFKYIPPTNRPLGSRNAKATSARRDSLKSRSPGAAPVNVHQVPATAVSDDRTALQTNTSYLLWEQPGSLDFLPESAARFGAGFSGHSTPPLPRVWNRVPSQRGVVPQARLSQSLTQQDAFDPYVRGNPAPVANWLQQDALNAGDDSFLSYEDALAASSSQSHSDQSLVQSASPSSSTTLSRRFSGSSTTSPLRAQHQCDRCLRRFRRPCELRMHQKTHIKPYLCSYVGCGRGFAAQRDLNRHEATHYPYRKYVCLVPGCGFASSRRDSWARHAGTVHLEVQYSIPEYAVEDLDAVDDSIRFEGLGINVGF